MRLLLQAALVKEKQPPVELAAAGEEPPSPVGRWFSANLDVKAVVAVLGFIFMLGGGYAAIQVSTARLEARLDSQQKQLDESRKENAEAVQRLYARFNSEVVSRKEIEDRAAAISTRFNGVEAQQQTLYTFMLNRALGGAR